MNKVIQAIRSKYHPLHRMRSSALGRFILRRFDFHVWLELNSIEHSLRINAFRNAAYIGNSSAIEPEVRICFDILSRHYPLSSFWDIGANIGYYSYYLHSQVKDLAVTAFEPDPGNLDNLKATKSKHHLAWLNIRSEAVSSSAEERTFFVDTLASVTGSLVDDEGIIDKKMHGVNEASVISVPTTTLDNELETDVPDLVKIDVEGAELLVLEGGRRLFEEKTPILIIEVKKDNLPNALRVLSNSYDDLFVIGDISRSHPNLLALPRKHVNRNKTFIDQCINAGLAIKAIAP